MTLFADAKFNPKPKNIRLIQNLKLPPALVEMRNINLSLSSLTND